MSELISHGVLVVCGAVLFGFWQRSAVAGFWMFVVLGLFVRGNYTA